MKTLFFLLGIIGIPGVAIMMITDYHIFMEWGFDPFWTSMVVLALIFIVLLFGKRIDKFVWDNIVSKFKK
jgi:hypothetical protein